MRRSSYSRTSQQQTTLNTITVSRIMEATGIRGTCTCVVSRSSRPREPPRVGGTDGHQQNKSTVNETATLYNNIRCPQIFTPNLLNVWCIKDNNTSTSRSFTHLPW